MKRTIDTKFFTFNQNNSGGYYFINDSVAEYLIIEAVNADEAILKMVAITDDYSDYCPCCGERWSTYIDDSDGTDMPTIWGEDARNPIRRFSDGSAIIHYYDGAKEKLRYPKGDEQ